MALLDARLAVYARCLKDGTQHPSDRLLGVKEFPFAFRARKLELQPRVPPVTAHDRAQAPRAGVGRLLARQGTQSPAGAVTSLP